MRLFLKNLLCRIGLGSLLIEYCGQCGIKQPLVWWCEDYVLWKHIDRKNETLCPNCFNAEALRLGIFLRWYPRNESARANSVSQTSVDPRSDAEPNWTVGPSHRVEFKFDERSRESIKKLKAQGHL